MADHQAGKGVDYLARDVTKSFAGVTVLRNVTVHGTIIFSAPLEFTKSKYLQYNF